MSIVVKVADLHHKVKELRHDGVHLVELSIIDDDDEPFMTVKSVDDPDFPAEYDDLPGVSEQC